MKFALCTISFRHQLISFPEIVNFARYHRFDGIEMWGIHAENLFEHARLRTEFELKSMKAEGISISMLSDYLSIGSEQDFASTLQRCDRLIQLARWMGTTKIRTFAGQVPSQTISLAERECYVTRIRKLCDRCSRFGIQLIVEIHPGTLADNLNSTMSLLSEVGHDLLRLNFDVMHVWEFGGEIEGHYQTLKPWVDYFHFKNIKEAGNVNIFEPSNVYAASGNREGMSLLGEGLIDYKKFLDQLGDRDLFASLEWFGSSPFKVLEKEITWLHQQQKSVVAGKFGIH
ncbi:3-dehydroshikimate dehydratase [compost metagenome]